MTRHLLFALFLLPAAPMALADPALTGTAAYGGWRNYRAAMTGKPRFLPGLF